MFSFFTITTEPVASLKQGSSLVSIGKLKPEAEFKEFEPWLKHDWFQCFEI